MFERLYEVIERLYRPPPPLYHTERGILCSHASIAPSSRQERVYTNYSKATTIHTRAGFTKRTKKKLRKFGVYFWHVSDPGTPFKPLNIIVFCDVWAVSGNVLNWARMIAERRRSLGRCSLVFAVRTSMESTPTDHNPGPILATRFKHSLRSYKIDTFFHL